jgi:hypothetical protein
VAVFALLKPTQHKLFVFLPLVEKEYNKDYIQSLLSVVTPALQLVLGLPLSKNLLAFFGGQGI